MKWLLILPLLYALAMASIAVDGLHDRSGAAEAALVLGTGGIRANGTPSPRLRARLDRAVEADRIHPFRKIIVSGGSVVHGPDEAEVMAAYLEKKGIPPERLILDHEGETTYDSARFTAAALRTENLHGVLVVTQYFHVPRTRLALERFGVRPVFSAHARRIEAHDLFMLAREVPAWIDYWFRHYRLV